MQPSDLLTRAADLIRDTAAAATKNYPAGCPVCAPAVKLARAVLGEKEEQ